jgi:hypothetical protein
VRRGTHRKHRAAIGFLDRTLDLCDQFDLGTAARVWVKSPGDHFNGRSVYTSTIQWLCARFCADLDAVNSMGLVVVDHRNPKSDSIVAHSVFTQRIKPASAYSSLVEIPVFAQSDNHAGIQIADVLVSGILTPVCCRHFLKGRLDNIHAADTPDVMVERFSPRLKTLFERFCPGLPAHKALLVADAVGGRGSSSLFAGGAPPSPAPVLATTPEIVVARESSEPHPPMP